MGVKHKVKFIKTYIRHTGDSKENFGQQIGFRMQCFETQKAFYGAWFTLLGPKRSIRSGYCMMTLDKNVTKKVIYVNKGSFWFWFDLCFLQCKVTHVNLILQLIRHVFFSRHWRE